MTAASGSAARAHPVRRAAASPATRPWPLAVCFSVELYTWPCVLDLAFDAQGLARAVTPRVLPPDWHSAHSRIIDDCARWTWLLGRAGGARKLRLTMPDHPVIGRCAELELACYETLQQAPKRIDARLALECGT